MGGYSFEAIASKVKRFFQYSFERHRVASYWKPLGARARAQVLGGVRVSGGEVLDMGN